MLQRQDALRYSSRNYRPFLGTLEIIALPALAGSTLLFLTSNKVEMPGDLDYTTSLYGP